MCGIIGYIGKKQALPVLIKGLRRLEYRGYDSAGVAILETDQNKTVIKRIRAVGRIDNLADKIKDEKFVGHVGIAHTRWATHGGVTEENAHPHFGCDDRLAIVHNGIIENYREIKEMLGNSHTYKTETDTEILAHLIESYYQGDLRLAIEKALSFVRGTYALVAIHSDHPDMVVAARLGSPLVVGVNSVDDNDEYFVASDASPILAYTKKVIFLDDNEVLEISNGKMNTFNLKDEIVQKNIEEIEWDESEAQKQGFPHFMLKEIFDQPRVFVDAIRGRYDLKNGISFLGGLNMTEEEMHSINKIILIACGTASYAGMVGKYAFERLAEISTTVEVSSEFRYSDPIVDNKTLVFVLSQSGETADTLAALREAKRKGAFVRGIVNVIGSSIARETDGGTYIHAGPELAVASTKAYTNTVAVLLLYALQFGRLKRTSLVTGERMLKAMLEIPEKMSKILAQSDKIKAIALKYKDCKNMMFIGRGINYPVALEGALKLKEISYIHADAFPGGELKHGHIALLSEDFPIFAIMTKDQLYDKMRSNVEEIKARKAPIILIATEGDESAKNLSEDIIFVPETLELLEPLLNSVALQLFAYHTAVLLGRDVDRPRNLAKSVTVE
ncbi:MAG: glutamine--fructose-6-phosphate transaminase (isomerizing) [Candidatus Magasanikbacteria bacterium CG_4_10_14_0_8_um_filter_32_14]|uniref:Glutamine--fructose-6-phosphate aminotransferase [isomerizing] n=2 Tax=Candidatus Magasanikiibacteriota TaxID=1752731 RepID=A0A2M7R922_9BACT|nr:MAG: glutamine--fructose-6-phosphate aminotransferase [Candidatus Magasanikbacteria bacterium CG1_02_32_51]PIY93240.1 MAG: glutamine--fructose-6-phosphate transaminase (isomerizing) [Candidatus Magasanikbacteria bacterium CG_4_10_14_0_8_um_filter_32_14]